jgi:hypothetical protein
MEQRGRTALMAAAHILPMPSTRVPSIMVGAIKGGRREATRGWKERVLGSALKVKCALGPFLSILVIECQHKCFYANLCKVVDKVKILSKGMFLDLVHCFYGLMYCV